MNDQAVQRRQTVWGVVAAWVVCLASLSLPWPGATLVVLLCCVAFFELASAWVGKGGTPPAPSTLEEMSDRRTDPAAAVGAPPAAAAAVARRWSPSAALAAAFQFLAGRLRLRAGWRGGLEEVGVTAVGGGAAGDGDGRVSAAPAKERAKSEVRERRTYQTEMPEAAARFPRCLQYLTTRNVDGRVLCGLPRMTRSVPDHVRVHTRKNSNGSGVVACMMRRKSSRSREGSLDGRYVALLVFAFFYSRRTERPFSGTQRSKF